MKTKICTVCNEDLPLSSFGKNGTTPAGTRKYKSKCHKCDADFSLRYFYQKVTEAVGGEANMKCVVCGYNRCLAALEFHHINPEEKERAISTMQNYSAESIKKEVDKCVLLCCICHREYHSGLLELPSVFSV